MLLNHKYILIDSESINEIFLEAIEKIRSKWSGFFDRDEETNFVKENIEKFGGDRGFIINYKKYCLAFNKSYLLKNLYKNLLAIQHLKSLDIDLNTPIFDLGSGAGPSSIAWCMLSPPNLWDVILIDQSEEQLNIAKQLMKIFEIESVSYQNNQVEDLHDGLEGTIFLSYWFCEQTPPAFLENPTNFRRLVKDALVFIDYPDNIKIFENNIKANFSFYTFNLEVIATPELKSYLYDDVIRVHGCYCKSQ